jgi:homoserine dehydrogenase
MSHKVIVLKFGSSVLRTDADSANAVHEIYRWVRVGYRAIAVISAIGEATNRLLAQSQALSPNPEPFAIAELLATGERSSAAMVGIALDRAGLPARVLNPREINLTVAGMPLDSTLVSVDVARLTELLRTVPVLVIPGFFGTDLAGRTHLLGRGGSDLSAVFLAHALGARCRLIKDVDGVYEFDPTACTDVFPRRFTTLNYKDALRVAGPLIQPKAVAYLSEHGGRAEVAALGRCYESAVQFGPTKLGGGALIQPLKVLLLGLGTVGLGVYQRLLANPGHFQVVGVLVRDRIKAEALSVPKGLLHTESEHVLGVQIDIIVDALPGVEPSRDLVEHFLARGAHVVSANKALIATHGAALSALAKAHGAILHYSAAVGGATPMIETVDQLVEYPIGHLAAVLNGTCNFILDACADGVTLTAAVAKAQSEGFAEADATEDISGRDAEHKLRILCRHAFRAEAKAIDIAHLDETEAKRAHEVVRMGKRLRQVARAARSGGDIDAQVRFEVVEADSLFGSLNREWNALEVVDTAGIVHRVAGRGAGRWPTTEAIMADLFELHRDRSAQ